MTDDSQAIAAMAATLARKKAAKKRKRSAARYLNGGDSYSYSLFALGLSKWLFNNALRGETGEKRFDPAESFGMVLNILFPRAIIM
eukprot:scaffold14092_cov226-Skeletonema_dohrnii-CCMP3373.AAC.1